MASPAIPVLQAQNYKSGWRTNSFCSTCCHCAAIADHLLLLRSQVRNHPAPHLGKLAKRPRLHTKTLPSYQPGPGPYCSPATKPVRVSTVHTSCRIGSAQLIAPVSGAGNEATANRMQQQQCCRHAGHLLWCSTFDCSRTWSCLCCCELPCITLLLLVLVLY